MSAEGELTPVFARMRTGEARKLGRASVELGVSKQALLTSLVAHYVDPDSPEGIERLRALADESLVVGRHSFTPAGSADVLTAQEVADLLRVGVEDVLDLAARGELPGRRVGEEWRFLRSAVLEWLGGGAAGSQSAPG
jgi:excisionase family DNA binding protein